MIYAKTQCQLHEGGSDLDEDALLAQEKASNAIERKPNQNQGSDKFLQNLAGKEFEPIHEILKSTNLLEETK